MTIRDQEEKLFQEWEGTREKFVKDGVVSEDSYLSSNPKIAFILKEVNSPEVGGWDLRKFLSDGGRRASWDVVTAWIHGIQNINAVPDWDYYRRPSNDFRVEMLKSVCVMNLKKSPGTHTTVKASLDKVATEDKGYINRQYEIYDPDITICGGTGGLFTYLLNFNSYERMTKKGIRWYERDDRKYVVYFSHPEARVDKSLLVYGLLDAIREIVAE